MGVLALYFTDLLTTRLLVRDRGGRAVELRDGNRKRFVVRLRAILQDAERDLFSQKY